MWKKGEDGVFSLAYPVSNRAKFPLVDISSDIGTFLILFFMFHTRSVD